MKITTTMIALKIMMMAMVMVTVKNDDDVNMMGTRTTIDDNDDAMLNFIP